MSFKKDYEYGLNKEKEILKVINNYFDRDIKQSIEKFCKYDFYDYKYNYELKSRRNNYNSYDTTLLPADKLQRKTIYLFSFNDGLYYIKYKKERFDEFEKKDFVRPKREDKKDVKKEYIYIPIDKLKKIEIKERINKNNEDDYTINFE